MIGQGEQDGRGFGDDLAFRQAQRRNLAAGIEAEKARLLLLVAFQRNQLEFIRRARFRQRGFGAKRRPIPDRRKACSSCLPTLRDHTSANGQKKKPAGMPAGFAFWEYGALPGKVDTGFPSGNATGII